MSLRNAACQLQQRIRSFKFFFKSPYGVSGVLLYSKQCFIRIVAENKEREREEWK